MPIERSESSLAALFGKETSFTAPSAVRSSCLTTCPSSLLARFERLSMLSGPSDSGR